MTFFAATAVVCWVRGSELDWVGGVIGLLLGGVGTAFAPGGAYTWHLSRRQPGP